MENKSMLKQFVIFLVFLLKCLLVTQFKSTKIDNSWSKMIFYLFPSIFFFKY